MSLLPDVSFDPVQQLVRVINYTQELGFLVPLVALYLKFQVSFKNNIVACSVHINI